jgi:hypothetical protein
VTTTTDPEDVMAAVSTFGSALKTTSSERSFPTLRGHPPTVELGEELELPGEVAPPATGVTVEVPPDLQYVYPAAPLAHYLGATLEPGAVPRLVTDTGVEHDLAGGEFHREVERVLKGTFLLDCVVRTEGLYDVDLQARREVERALDRDLNLAALYDRPLAERLAAYLSVPYDALAPAVPDWKLTAYVEATPESVETLPFLVDDLAVVRPAGVAASDGAGEPAGAATDRTTARQAGVVDGLLRGAGDWVAPAPDPGVAVDGERTMELAWAGAGAPRGASKVTPMGFHNRLARDGPAADTRVVVVCNDEAMRAEHEAAGDAYRDGSLAVDRREQLTTGELRDVLAGEASFLHFVGHVEEDGFRCPDGSLDARLLETVGLESFLLNACTSYHQGMALVEAGAVGGVVTLADVVNDHGVRVGSTVARLLDNGYPLRPALEIARHAYDAAADYVVVGDGRVRVAKTETTLLDLYRVSHDGEAYRLQFLSYTDRIAGMGTMKSPNVADNDLFFLGPGVVEEFRFDDAESLLEFLHLPKEVPVLLEGALHWSTDVEAPDLQK